MSFSYVPIFLCHRTKFLLGYMPRHSRVFLMDKSFAVVSYLLHLDTINYQTAVLRKDFQAAQQLLPKIPEGDRTRIAHFLEAQGYAKQALKVSLDPDHRFELAVQLGDLVYSLASQLVISLISVLLRPSLWRRPRMTRALAANINGNSSQTSLSQYILLSSRSPFILTLSDLEF